VFGEAGEDSCNLRGRLAFAENDLGHAISQSAVMIDFGETQIFERQMAEAGDGVVRREFAFTDLHEEFADGFGVQKSTQRSAVSI
jgi:hypothetical protein